jgi:hypothetical protein
LEAPALSPVLTSLKDPNSPRPARIRPDLLAKRGHRGGIGADFRADFDDRVGRDVEAPGRGADGLGIRRLIEAIGLSLIGAQEREQPLDTDLVVDLFK